MKKRFQKGVTLIEILVVAGVTVLLTAGLVSSSLKARLNITEVAQIIVADIRQAQANAISAKQFIDTDGEIKFPCGYGVHMTTSATVEDIPDHPYKKSYIIYTNKLPTLAKCQNPNLFPYSVSDSVIIKTRILDDRLELCEDNLGSYGCINITNLPSSPPSQIPVFKDIFFQSPRGDIYIEKSNDITNKNKNRSQIVIRKKGAACPSKDCMYICVYSFGIIEQRPDPCPYIP